MAAKTLYDFFGGNLPSVLSRSTMYETLGLGKASDYVGSAEQNTAFLAKLNSGISPTAAPVSSPAPVDTSKPFNQSPYTPAAPAVQTPYTPVDTSKPMNQSPYTPAAPVAPAIQTPYAPSPTNITANVPKGPITTSALEQSSQLPDPATLAMSGQNGNPVAKVAGMVAATTMTSVQSEIESLMKKRDELIAKEKADAEAAVSKDRAAIEARTNSTASQDAYNASIQKYDITNKIDLFTQIQNKIVSAQEALNMGLIYEGDRHARMDVILGRQASLQKQGLALIGALQGTAAVIKGNIDLGLSLANANIQAIQEDNKNSLTALTTLLNLDNSKLVSLNVEERDAVKDRIAQLNKELATQQSNSEKILGYMKDYPEAFLKGGVTLLDSPETALEKMLPTLSANEKIKFDAEIAAKNRANANTNDAAGKAADKNALLDAKSKGMSYDEAVIAFGGVLDITWINSIYQQAKTQQGAAADVKDMAFKNYMNPDGSLKDNIIAGVDAKGQATLTAAPGYTLDPTTGTAVKDAPGLWDSFTSWFSK